MAVNLRYLTICVLTLVAITFAVAPARATGDLGNSGKFVGWWELGGYYGTDDSSRGEAVLFTPLMQSATTLFFLDARGKLFEEDVQEANVALGYRQMMASDWNLGLWAGWDVRDTEIDNTFHQVSFGVEALSERFDVRLNGYVPVTDPKGSTSTAEVFLRGNNILMTGGEEVALYGVDGEVGMLLFASNRGGGGGLKGAPTLAKRHELRGYVGGFWFDDDDAIEEVAGPKGRLEYRINDVISSLPGSRLTVESELSHDEVRDTKFEIGARLRIPFGARGSDAASRTAALNAQELRMTEGLERDTDIITVESKEENVIDVATNVALNSVSIAKNANQFANAVDKGGNRLIILQRGSKQIDVSATDGQTLQKNQTVQGGASTILMRGARTGTIAGFTAPGKRPTLFSDDATFERGVITINGNNTHIAGVNIRGNGGLNTTIFNNHGILGLNNLNNVVLEQLDIRNMGDDGVSFDDNNRNIRIYDTKISNVAFDAIDFEDGNRNISIKGLWVENVGQEGVTFNDDNANIYIGDAWFKDIDDNAIQFRDNNRNITIKYATMINIADAVNFNDDNTNVLIYDVSIDGARSDSIEFDNGNKNVTIEHVTIRNSANEAIDFEDDNTVLIRNVRIVDTDFDAIEINGDNTVMTIVDTIIDGTISGGGNAVEINGTGNVVNINNTTFAGTIQDHILDVFPAGNFVNGANNPNNATVGVAICDGAGNFTGTIEIGNVTIVDGGPPCI